MRHHLLRLSGDVLAEDSPGVTNSASAFARASSAKGKVGAAKGGSGTDGGAGEERNFVRLPKVSRII